MKKRIFFLTFIIILFFLSSTLTFAPGSRPGEDQKNFTTISGQVVPPNQFEKWKQEKEEFVKRERSAYGFKADASNVELVGMWPYGQSRACAIDASRNIAVIGNGDTLQVLDITTPSNPTQIGELYLEGEPGGITLSGNYAYVVTRNYLKIINILNPYSPSEVGSIYVSACDFRHVAVSSNYAYVAASCSGLLIFDVSDPANPNYVIQYMHDNLHVYDVAIWGNYAICDCAYWSPTDWTYGIEVIDISTPSSPSLAGTFDLGINYYTSGLDVTGSGYVYLCQNDNNSSNGEITVIDVASDPSNPTEIGSYTETDFHFNDVTILGSYAYCFANCQLKVLDISTPSIPFKVGELDSPEGCFHDLDVSGNYVGISHCNNFSLYDVSDRSNPAHLGDYAIPGSSDCCNGNRVVVSGDYVYISNNNYGLSIMDVSILSDPAPVSTCSDVWPHRGLAISGYYAFCVDGCGLGIADISSPNNPFKVSYLNQNCDYDWRDIVLSGNYAYISGMEWSSNDSWANLSVIDISDPLNPMFVGYWVSSVLSGHHQGGLAVSGNYVYLAVDDYVSNKAVLKILDISNPTNPSEVGTYTTTWSWCNDVAVRGDYAYLAGESFSIIDISTPSMPSEVSTYSYCCIQSVALSGDYAYLVQNNWELKIIDISDPNNPTDAGYYQSEVIGNTIAVSGNKAYLGGSLYIFRNTLAPEVSITSPSPFSILHGSVSIDVQASHSSGISKVEFYIDDVLKSTDLSAPYSFNWDTTSESEGVYKLRARAYNNNGKSSDAEIEVSVRNQWDLTISALPGGTTSPAAGTYSYSYGSNVFVTANPDSGYEFLRWTGDVPPADETDNPVTITMDKDKSITANFSVVSGNHELTIHSSPGGTTNPVPGVYSYVNGTEVSVDAIPDPGSIFLYWTGNVPWGHQHDDPISITMDSAKSLTPHFSYAGDYYIESQIQHQYLGGGTAQNFHVDDDTIAYPLPFNFKFFGETFSAGTNIYICENGFIDFGDVPADPTNSVSELIDSKRIAPLWIDLVTDGSAQGMEDIYITEQYEYLSVRWVAETFATAEPVNFQVILYRDGRIQFNYDGGNADFSDQPPTIGISKSSGIYYNLSAYNGAISLTNVDSDLFTPAVQDNPPNVSITSPWDGQEISGTITIWVSASDDNQVKAVEFYIDEELKYTDMTQPYYYDWDTLTYSAGSHTIKAIAYDNVYQTREHQISVTISGHTLNIYSTSGGTTDPEPGNYSYTSGTDVQITAFPNSGFNFTGWQGDVQGGQEMINPITINMDRDKWIQATFAPQPGNYELSIGADPGGTTDPPPGSYAYPAGTDVEVEAIPDSGISFWYWQGDIPSGHEYDNPITIDMDSNKYITAKFRYPQMWTFMVYLDGDNNLEGAGIDDFLEMASIGSDGNINIVVQFDRISGHDTRYGDWTSTKRFYITNGMTPDPGNALQDLGELNHGDPQTLINFINWSKENYPATYYALILWNHGGGWRESKEEQRRMILEAKKKLNFKAVCWDDTDGGDSLYTDDVHHSLNMTGFTHLIGFDACLMGMVEVAYQLRDNGSVMVGSEDIEPGPGWPYDAILQDLKDNYEWSAAELGTAIVDRYYESYGDDYTHSAIDLGRVSSLAWAIDSFAWSMVNNWDSDQNAVRNEAQNVITEIENTVIHEQHGSSWAGAHGLAIYFPQTYGEYNSDYENVIYFTGDIYWAGFLQEFYSSMGGSWISLRRACSQQFDVPQHIDLYHFCELVGTEPGDYYAPSQGSSDFIGSGTAWGFNYDDATRTYSLPFDFPYFGEVIPAGTDIYICTNGYVDFEYPWPDWSNSLSELANNKRIAVCWTDLKTNGSAQGGEDVYLAQNIASAQKNISVTRNPDDLVIRWVAETVFGGDPVNVELVLYDDGRIKFNYGGGNTDFSGQPPTIGISKGDGINLYISSYNGSNNLNNVGSEIFAPEGYNLTIMSGLGGTTNPAPGSYFYAEYEDVTITAIPNTCYDFASWSGDASGSDNPITINMDSSKMITANFRRINPPSSFSVRQEYNRSLLVGEYINVLTWSANPSNVNITEYKIYNVTGGISISIATVAADQNYYWHKDVDITQSYEYALAAVSGQGNEGDLAYTSIQGQGGSAQAGRTKSSITSQSGAGRSGATEAKENLIIIEPASKKELKERAEEVHQPLNFAVQKVWDYSLPQMKFSNVLVWQPNPENQAIDKYRIFTVEGGGRKLLAELKAGTFEYVHREVEQNKKYRYALVAVDKKNRECKPVYAEIK